MCKSIDLTTFRTVTGPERKTAMRAYLRQSYGLEFGLDPHAITMSQQCALADLAKAVSWKKSITSPLSLGLAFYVYLSRDVVPAVPRKSRTPGQKRGPGITYGRTVQA